MGWGWAIAGEWGRGKAGGCWALGQGPNRLGVLQPHLQHLCGPVSLSLPDSCRLLSWADSPAGPQFPSTFHLGLSPSPNHRAAGWGGLCLRCNSSFLPLLLLFTGVVFQGTSDDCLRILDLERNPPLRATFFLLSLENCSKRTFSWDLGDMGGGWAGHSTSQVAGSSFIGKRVLSQ